MGNKEMAEELNLYFASVFTKEDMNKVPEVLRKTHFSEELKEISIRREMILGKLMGLKVDKSPGPDNLHPRVLKEVALEIVDPSMCVWSLHILLVSVWVSSGCSGFLPQSKDVRVRLIGYAKKKLPVRVLRCVG